MVVMTRITPVVPRSHASASGPGMSQIKGFPELMQQLLAAMETVSLLPQEPRPVSASPPRDPPAPKETGKENPGSPGAARKAAEDDQDTPAARRKAASSSPDPDDPEGKGKAEEVLEEAVGGEEEVLLPVPAVSEEESSETDTETADRSISGDGPEIPSPASTLPSWVLPTAASGDTESLLPVGETVGKSGAMDPVPAPAGEPMADSESAGVDPAASRVPLAAPTADGSEGVGPQPGTGEIPGAFRPDPGISTMFPVTEDSFSGAMDQEWATRLPSPLAQASADEAVPDSDRWDYFSEPLDVGRPAPDPVSREAGIGLEAAKFQILQSGGGGETMKVTLRFFEETPVSRVAGVTGEVDNSYSSGIPPRAEGSDPPRSPRAAGPEFEARQEKLVQRIAWISRLVKSQGTTSMRMWLSPPQLGEVRIHLALRDGALKLSLQTETSMARAVLQQHAGLLRQQLADQGVDLQEVNVSLEQGSRQDDAEGMGTGPSGQDDPSSRQSWDPPVPGAVAGGSFGTGIPEAIPVGVGVGEATLSLRQGLVDMWF